MLGRIMNHLLITQYEKLLGELYLEPKDEEIMGTLLLVIREINFMGTNQCMPCEASSTKKNKKKTEVRSRDIWDMFRKKNTMWYSCNQLGFGNQMNEWGIWYSTSERKNVWKMTWIRTHKWNQQLWLWKHQRIYLALQKWLIATNCRNAVETYHIKMQNYLI